MRFYWLLWVAIQKSRKAIDNVRVDLNKNSSLRLFSASFPVILNWQLTCLRLVISTATLTMSWRNSWSSTKGQMHYKLISTTFLKTIFANQLQTTFHSKLASSWLFITICLEGCVNVALCILFIWYLFGKKYMPPKVSASITANGKPFKMFTAKS